MDENLGMNFTVCFYCEKYGEHIPDYPINVAESGGMTPRCLLHGRYKCDGCQEGRHFNGISWCHECKVFTCVRCSSAEVVPKKFIIYGHYYQVSCQSCGKPQPTLEYAEFVGMHPFQMGDIRPNFVVNVWFPLTPLQEHRINMHEIRREEKHSGMRRLLELTATSGGVKEITRHGNIHPSHSDITEQQERQLLHGQFLKSISSLIPEMIEIPKDAKIIEIHDGWSITTELNKWDISAFNLSELNWTEIGNSGVFDIAIVNVLNSEKTLQKVEESLNNVKSVLKRGGKLVLSLPNPYRSVVETIRIPFDSEKDTDEIPLIRNGVSSYKEEESKVSSTSTYINTLVNCGFRLLRMEETSITPSEATKTVKKIGHLPLVQVFLARVE